MRGVRFGVSLVLFVALVPGMAWASGYEYPENGAKGLAQGGAFAADPTDGTALYYNPAGLADQTGTRVLLDGHFVWLSTAFQRLGVDGKAMGDAVHNAYAPWIAPFLAVSHQIIPHLTVAAGIYGPSAYGALRYPDPRKIAPTFFDKNPNNDPTDTTNISTQAPQRYMLIDSNIIVLYPSLAVAWAPTKWLSLGVTGQVVLGNTAFTQAIYAGLSPGEDPGSDAIAALSVTNKPAFTGIFGIQIRPAEGLVMGFSFRPKFQTTGDGTLDVTFNDSLKGLLDTLGAGLVGNKATLTTDFPNVYRFGTAVHHHGWEGELDVVYEEWSAVHSLVVHPDIKLKFGGQETPLPDIKIPKNWRDAVSFRLGGKVDLKRAYGLHVPLTIRAGYTYSDSAIPPSTLGIDFIDGTRNQLSVGATYDLGWLGITLTASHIFQDQITVGGSDVLQQVSTPPGVSYPGSVVGNGTYDASTTLLVLGLEGKFGA